MAGPSLTDFERVFRSLGFLFMSERGQERGFGVQSRGDSKSRIQTAENGRCQQELPQMHVGRQFTEEAAHWRDLLRRCKGFDLKSR